MTMKKNHFSLFTLLLLATAIMTACSDMLSTESEVVEFEENNTLNNPTDSMYNVMGIVNKIQSIADRVVLLGEVRGDLVVTTEEASADLKQLASFDLEKSNKYCRISDYYAVINNCNYIIAHLDTALARRGKKVFEKEYAAAKGFRAWTYLQLVLNYGKVPLVTEPVMTENQAEITVNSDYKGIEEICNFFIDDIKDYANVKTPDYGNVGENNKHHSQDFFIPMRALLGDLCLWAGRYREAASWYHDYLSDKDYPILPNITNYVRWRSITEYKTPSDLYSVNDDYEVLSYIPMETRIFDGTVSDLYNVFCSTTENKRYYQVTPSRNMRTLSAKQIYCQEYHNTNSIDTIYVPRTGLLDSIYLGDLRLSSNYRMSSLGGQNKYSEYNTDYQTIFKINRGAIITYRRTIVWLRYAEALCRAGFPQSAFCILKYGLCNENALSYIDEEERTAAAGLIEFNETWFMRNSTMGIHSAGSGDSQCNKYYTLPMPTSELATRQDTIDWQIPLVEDYIINEMALEGSFEGYRFFDLMRVALRRNDPAYLALPISCRNKEKDEALYEKLMNTDNWYLPLK